jgi:hypothetical protein
MRERLAHLSVSKGSDSTRNDRDLEKGVGKLEEPSADGVASLVVSDRLLLVLAENPALALESNDDALDGRLKVALANGVALSPRAVERRLVADVGDISARETWREEGELLGDELPRKVLLDREWLEVDHEDLPAAANVRAIDGDMAVESTGTHERRVKDVGSIRSGEDDNACGRRG